MKDNKLVMHRYILSFFLAYFFLLCSIKAQESSRLPDKVHHAEPLYNDLVRDLGARKGEKEINLGIDIRKMSHTDEYGYLAEYEFAPIDRLGLEVETDFSYSKSYIATAASNNKLERLRLSSQYSFFVSKVHSTTLAVGYTQIIDFSDNGTAFNPFFVAAKSWDKNFHTLIYTGPEIAVGDSESGSEVNWQINTSFLYTIPHTDHFIGIEVNQEISHSELKTILRPQLKVALNEKLAVGMAVGLPIHHHENVVSGFLRLIYQL